MKKIIIIITIVFTSNVSIGQNFTELANYKFDTKESYKAEENKVLQSAKYLFNNPTNKSELDRLTAIQYIMKWMEGTPDHTFDIGEKSMELTKGNPDLFSLYLAAMSKVVIENKGEKLNKEEVYNQAEEVLIDYCANPKNKIKPSKKIKKILKSNKV